MKGLFIRIKHLFGYHTYELLDDPDNCGGCEVCARMPKQRYFCVICWQLKPAEVLDFDL